MSDFDNKYSLFMIYDHKCIKINMLNFDKSSVVRERTTENRKFYLLRITSHQAGGKIV